MIICCSFFSHACVRLMFGVICSCPMFFFLKLTAFETFPAFVVCLQFFFRTFGIEAFDFKETGVNLKYFTFLQVVVSCCDITATAIVVIVLLSMLFMCVFCFFNVEYECIFSACMWQQLLLKQYAAYQIELPLLIHGLAAQLRALLYCFSTLFVLVGVCMHVFGCEWMSVCVCVAPFHHYIEYKRRKLSTKTHVPPWFFVLSDTPRP